MAKAARTPPNDDGEIKKKDFKGAVRTYLKDIAPNGAKIGDLAQEMSTAYKHIKKVHLIQSGAAKLAFKLKEMEDAKRDDWLRGFNGLLDEMSINIAPDLVDAMQQQQPAKLALVTIPTGPADDSDLAGQ
jgi:hypothetical protein